jgi:2-oxoglutarate ferredoxin oxidoreductase subunit delta
MNQVIIDFERCKECGYCVNFCPKSILKIGGKINKKGYYPPLFERPEDCVACGTCAKVCPEAAIQVYKDDVKNV